METTDQTTARGDLDALAYRLPEYSRDAIQHLDYKDLAELLSICSPEASARLSQGTHHPWAGFMPGMTRPISDASIRLAKAEAAEVATREEREGSTCSCGHTAHWHSHCGKGACEFGQGCECEAFAHTDGRDGPDEDRAYDEWRDR